MSKKAVETKENETEVKKKRKSLRPLFMLMLPVLIGGGGYYVWENFDELKEKTAFFYHQKNISSEVAENKEPDWSALLDKKADKASVLSLQEKIVNLQTIVGELTLRQNSISDIKNLNERVDNMQDLLIASVNGKADAQAVLGLMVRLDKLENEMSRLSRLNNEGAIMLAAVMLIKERAAEGKDFAFEASMLSELAGYKQKIAEPVKVIENAAQKGVASNAVLTHEFDEIYADLNSFDAKAQIEQNWKDRLNAKLGELISIHKTQETEAADEQKTLMKSIRELADNQQFTQIATLFKGTGYAKMPVVHRWLEKVEAKAEFDAAISKISAYCLVLMKVNNLLVREQ